MTIKGKRKFIMTIVTSLFALAGLAVIGWIFKDVKGTTVAMQLYLIYCLACAGSLTAFVTSNVFEHFAIAKGGDK